MRAIDRLRARLCHPGPRLALPEGDDLRVVDAALRIGAGGFARPVVVGDPAVVAARAAALGLDATAVAVASPPAGHPPPEVVGATLVRSGRADALLAGTTSTTHDVLVACRDVLGLGNGVTLPSGFFLVETVDGRSYLFADCAVNPDPDPEELAEIALQTAASARALFGWEPRVAMLSFSTHGSAQHRHVQKVRAATAIARAAEPTLLLDGELQADAAVDLDVARRKLDPVGAVAGRANVLVFPDLDAGNIAYKLVRGLGGARAVGVVLQGYRAPAADASRGATVDELVDTAVVLAALARRGAPGPTTAGCLDHTPVRST